MLPPRLDVTLRVRPSSLNDSLSLTSFSYAALVLAVALAVAAPLAAQPSSDFCSSATAIGVGVTPFDTTGTVFNGANLTGGCNLVGDAMFDNDVYFCFTAPSSGTFEIEVLKLSDTGMVGPPFDPRFAVLDGCACPPVGSQVLVCAEGDPVSTGQFDAVAGNQYLVIVGSFFAFGTGTGQITISAGTPPVEDLLCDGNPTGVELTWNLPTFAPGVSYDGGILVYREGQLEASLPGTATTFSYSAAPGSMGTTHFCVEGISSTFGAAAQVCCTAVIGGPPNDDCDDALSVTLGDTAFDSFLATLDGPSVASSCPNVVGTPDIWFRFTPAATQTYEILLCNGTTFDSALGVYADTGTCPPSASDLLDCDDNFCGLQSRVVLTLQGGASYLIQVSGNNGQSGAGVLTLQSPCGGLTGLSCDYDCALGELDLSWINGAAYTNVEIERDGMLVASLPGNASAFQETGLANGLVSYTVRGICANGSASENSCEIHVLSPAASYDDLIVALEVQTITGFPGLTDSSVALQSALEANGRNVAILRHEFLAYPCLTEVTTDLAGIWVMTGTFPFDRHVSLTEGDFLAGLAASGTVIYLEGGDHWGFNHIASALNERDGVSESFTGDGDDSFDSMDGATAVLAGIDTSAFQAVSYTSDASTGDDRTDQLEPALDPGLASTEVIWTNDDNSPGGTEGAYVTGIVATHSDGGVMISCSWEFGGFNGDPVTLAAAYLDAFPSAEPDFRRGDCNNDGSINLPDAVATLVYLFPPAGCTPGVDCAILDCEDACDSNDDGSINLSDAISLLGVLFPPPGCVPSGTCPMIPSPGPQCGIDPTTDTLDCLGASCP